MPAYPSRSLGGPAAFALDQVFCAGRIVQEGCFGDAVACFQACLGSWGLGEPRRFLVKATVADLTASWPAPGRSTLLGQQAWSSRSFNS